MKTWESITGVFLVIVVLFIVSPPRQHVSRSDRAPASKRCGNNLRHIGLALHNYHDVYFTFPPVFSVDKEGRPQHSWRTLLLPSLDLRPLSDSAHMDEPWDSDFNAKHFQQTIPWYACPSAEKEVDRPTTNYLAIVGPNTLWGRSREGKGNELQETSILVVEMENTDILWSEPRDLNLAEMSFQLSDPAGNSPSSPHIETQGWGPWKSSAQVVNVLYADGHVESLTAEKLAEQLQKMATGIPANSPP